MNIVESPDLKVWFTSDLHLGHDKSFVWESRGFGSSAEHTDGVINSINAKVRAGDILFMLGDFCLNSTVDQFKEYLNKISCKNVWCLWGNHNNPHMKQIYRPEKDKLLLIPGREDVYPVKYKNMTYLGHYQEVTVNGQYIVLFHYPLLSWNHQAKGSWALVGHEHGGLPATLPENKVGKILDVGWDIYKSPVSFDEVKKIMDTKSVHGNGHHSP